MSIEKVLAARGNNYGSFGGQANLVQNLKTIVRNHEKWGGLPCDTKESIEMILHKLGRIINGDPSYKDSYIDIVGYAQLIINRLEKETK